MLSCGCFLVLLAIWQQPSGSVSNSFIDVFEFMFTASCSAATITSSSMGYTDCTPMASPSFMRMHSSGECRLSRQSYDGGAMIMLAPAVILSL